MKFQTICLLTILLLFAGCLPHVEVAEPLPDNQAKQNALIDTVQAWLPQTFQTHQHIVFHQHGRQVPFDLFVAVDRLGALRMQARGDFGSKWFDVEIQEASPVVLTNHTPFADQMLINGFFRDQQLMWHLPSFKNSSLWRYDDRTLGLRCLCGDETWEYVFVEQSLQRIRILQGESITREVHLTMDKDGFVQSFTITNHLQGYSVEGELVRVTQD